MSRSTKIKCDCCETETLAVVRDGKLIIIDKRHGRKHMVVLTLEEIRDLIKGSTANLSSVET